MKKRTAVLFAMALLSAGLGAVTPSGATEETGTATKTETVHSADALGIGRVVNVVGATSMRPDGSAVIARRTTQQGVFSDLVDLKTGSRAPAGSFTGWDASGRWLIDPVAGRYDVDTGVMTPWPYFGVAADGSIQRFGTQSYDGNTVLTASVDPRNGRGFNNRLFDMTTGLSQPLPADIYGVDLSRDVRFVMAYTCTTDIFACGERTFRAYDTRTGRTDVLAGFFISFSVDSRRALLLDGDNRPYWHDLITRRDTPVANVPAGAVLYRISEDEQRALIRLADGTHVLDLSTGQTVRINQFDGTFSNDGRVVFVQGLFSENLGRVFFLTPPPLGAVVPAGGTIEVAVSGKNGVPSDAAAVALNVTVTDTEGAGYLTAWPCGTPRPLASNLNYVAGEVVANLAVVRPGANGAVCIYSSAAANIVADLAGWFPASSPVSVGTPSRALDTRSGPKPGATGVVSVQLPSSFNGAILNVTAVDAEGEGYVTVWPCDRTRPTASNLNYVPGRVAAGVAFVAPSSDGRVCFFTYASAHIVVDIDGAFTGSEPVLINGQRLVDTRLGIPTPTLAPGNDLSVVVARGNPAPSGSTAVVLTVTSTLAQDDGYITVWPCDQAKPFTSNVNAARGIDRASVVLAKPSASGAVCFSSFGRTEMVVDASGWFLDGFIAVTPVRLADTRIDARTF